MKSNLISFYKVILTLKLLFVNKFSFAGFFMFFYVLVDLDDFINFYDFTNFCNFISVHNFINFCKSIRTSDFTSSYDLITPSELIKFTKKSALKAD